MRHRRPGPAARHRARAAKEGSLTEPLFVGSFPLADVSLDPPLPEVALVGRSNVGKSSLLNALVGQRIAKVSATPGKTTMLNVFRVVIRRGESRVVPDGADRPSDSHSHVPLPTPHALYLLDLPGYGYARASHTDRRKFGLLIKHALNRPRLAGVVWLLDIRREPSAEDMGIHEVFTAASTPILAALTKGDTLSRGRRLEQARALSATVSLPPDQVIVTSARTKDGMPELREAIAALVNAVAA